jgi:hypothetical protein
MRDGGWEGGKLERGRGEGKERGEGGLNDNGRSF